MIAGAVGKAKEEDLKLALGNLCVCLHAVEIMFKTNPEPDAPIVFDEDQVRTACPIIVIGPSGSCGGGILQDETQRILEALGNAQA